VQPLAAGDAAQTHPRRRPAVAAVAAITPRVYLEELRRLPDDGAGAAAHAGQRCRHARARLDLIPDNRHVAAWEGLVRPLADLAPCLQQRGLILAAERFLVALVRVRCRPDGQAGVGHARLAHALPLLGLPPLRADDLIRHPRELGVADG